MSFHFLIHSRRAAHPLQDIASLLLTLTALDLGVDLICARVEQIDCLVLELPHIAIQAKVVSAFINSLTRDQLRGLDSYCRCLCYHWRLSRAGHQAEAEQPNHEQPGCCV